jgi:hypothetical protein
MAAERPTRAVAILLDSSKQRGAHTMKFNSPDSEQALARSAHASELVRQALNQIVGDANDAGWGTDEIIVAIADAADKLKTANVKDPDPAEDPAVSDIPADGGQIGQGEIFD